MPRTIILWIIAFLLTAGSAYYQRTTGPTYPVSGTTAFGSTNVEYTLTRTHGGEGNQEVSIIVPDTKITGRVLFKRYKTGDPWDICPMRRQGDKLIGELPHQAPAGKLEYRVEMMYGIEVLELPGEGATIVTRFKSDVPAWALIPHIIFIFFAMLFSLRAGLEALFADAKPRSYTLWTIGLFIPGGFIFGPIVQHFAFGAYWTGFPFGMDLTDNKTLIAGIGWLIATIAFWSPGSEIVHPKRRWVVLGASLVMLFVFLVPHSMFGSELDYSKLDQQHLPDGQVQTE